MLVTISFIISCGSAGSQSSGSISLSMERTTMTIGESEQAELLMADSSLPATWSTANSSIVTVSANGLVTCADAGTATITAEYESTNYTQTIQCNPAGSYSMNPGITRDITEDFIIEVDGDTNISGSIQSSGASGQSVQIRSSGNIVIDGSISSGGSNSGNGGGVTLESTNGNITLSGNIISGNGSIGTARVLMTKEDVYSRAASDASGSDGGDIIVKAPNGKVIIDPTFDATLGNGGNGNTVTIGDEALLSYDPNSEDGKGGDSGRIIIQASEVEGMTCTEYEVTEEHTYGDITLAVGDKVCVATDMVISGGEGGDGGELQYGTDVDNNDLWPDTLPAKYARAESDTTIIKGRDGGDGFKKGR